MKIFAVLVAITLFFSSVALAQQAAQGGYSLPDVQSLSEAKESFMKAVDLEAKGDMELPRRPGMAQRHYEHAEDYYLKASFQYRELGHKNGVDVTDAIALCEKKVREVHVKVGKARAARKRSGAGRM